MNKLYLFTMTKEFETGANHIVELFHRLLAEASSRRQDRQHLAYRSIAVQKRTRNYISFHTQSAWLHCLCFRTSTFFTSTITMPSAKSRKAAAISDLHFELQATYAENPNVTHLQSLVSWSGLCQNENALLKFLAISHFSHYRFPNYK